MLFRWVSASQRLPLALRLAIQPVVRAARLSLGYLAYLRSFLRAPSYIRERWDGERELAGARRVALFAHYDGRGAVHDFVYGYLRQLASIGFAVVLVSNAPHLAEADVARLRGCCALILRRGNVGYDFGAYKEALAEIPDLGAVDCLLLANDSVYGPLHHLGTVVDRMNPAEADVWRATDSWEFSFHLQSYFLLFHRSALRTKAFTEFWRRVRFVQSKNWVVRKYEIGLTRVLSRAGLRCRAAYLYRTAAALVEAVIERGVISESLDPVRKLFLQQLFRAVNAGIPLNTTHFFRDYLISRMGYPFLKRELLQHNPARIPLLTYWERVIRDSSDYDIDLILRQLEVALKNRSV